MRAWLLLAALLFAITAFALPRDQAQVRAFKRANPCPITGQTKGRCPGYEVDHIRALRCGGPDRPGNMAWITIADHKLKTKRESKRCLKKR